MNPQPSKRVEIFLHFALAFALCMCIELFGQKHSLFLCAMPWRFLRKFLPLGDYHEIFTTCCAALNFFILTTGAAFACKTVYKKATKKRQADKPEDTKFEPRIKPRKRLRAISFITWTIIFYALLLRAEWIFGFVFAMPWIFVFILFKIPCPPVLFIACVLLNCWILARLTVAYLMMPIYCRIMKRREKNRM
jgi:hypothetical protein